MAKQYNSGDIIHIITPVEEAIVKIEKIIQNRDALEPDGYSVKLLFHKSIEACPPIEMLSEKDIGTVINVSYNFINRFSKINTEEWWNILYND